VQSLDEQQALNGNGASGGLTGIPTAYKVREQVRSPLIRMSYLLCNRLAQRVLKGPFHGHTTEERMPFLVIHAGLATHLLTGGVCAWDKMYHTLICTPSVVPSPASLPVECTLL
jgi:hypothetical protein